MPKIAPFRGFRYVTDEQDITTLIAPPYDVQTQEESEARLAVDPENIVALELATGSTDPDSSESRYSHARELWDRWKEEGIVEQDEYDSLYVLEQAFSLDGAEHHRTVFICAMELHGFDEGVVFPHERTLPKPLEDRYQLMRATDVNLSPVFGLYSDPTPAYSALLLDAKKGDPVAVGMLDGVECRLWKIDDREIIDRFAKSIADENVFLADGHHRYTVALRWRDTVRSEQGIPEDDPHNRIMIALANTDDPQLLVLPYHRAVKARNGFSPAPFKTALMEHFDIIPGDTADLARAQRPAFLVDYGEGTVLATLREDIDLDSLIELDHSPAWKQLDVTVLQELVLGPLFGISIDDPASLARMRFSHDISMLNRQLETGEVSAVFTMRPVTMDELRAVSLSGEVMPQKSTYFYPKLPSGFVFRDMSEAS